MRKWIFLIAVIIIGIVGYNYVYQDHRDVTSETAEFVMTTDELQSEIESKPSSAEGKYLNKTIEVTGVISELERNSLTLDTKVFCQLINTPTKSIKLGQKVTIKGRSIGYDDILEQFKLDQCIIIN